MPIQDAQHNGYFIQEVIPLLLQTDRLLLRQYTPDDFDRLYEILSDPETMKHYPKPYDEKGVKAWIQWSLDNYAVFGFGLWAVVLKETGVMIGDCGITMQPINKKIRPEIGYHIHKDYQRRGYATEAAARCIDFAFENTTFGMLFSYMKYTNVPSYTVAMKNGMHFVEEYADPEDTFIRVYAITRDEWKARKQRA